MRLVQGDATLSELRGGQNEISFPGLPERNPGLKLANAFSVLPPKDVRWPSAVFKQSLQPSDELEFSTSNGDYFHLRIHFLFEHSLDGHQRTSQRTRATAASALVTDAQGVLLQSEHF